MSSRSVQSNGIRREPFHRVHRTFFVGLFALIPVVLIPALFIYTIGKAEWFQDWLNLHVVYETSYGVSAGDVVTVSDIVVGHVKNVELTAGGRALVRFRILRKHADLVRKDSRAMLERKNMVFGDWVIALTRGDPRQPAVEENDTLPGEPPMRLDVVVDQVRSMVNTVENLLREVEQGKGLIGHLIREDTLVRAVHGVLDDFSRLAHSSTRAVHEAEDAFGRFGELSDVGIRVADSIGTLVDSVAPVIGETKALLENLRDASGQLSPVLRQAHVDLEQIEVLLRGLRNHWLLRRAVKKHKEEEAETSADAPRE